MHPDDVPRFAQLGVTASVQFTHATSDRDVADRLWGERAAHAYPYRSLLDAGARAGRRLGRADRGDGPARRPPRRGPPHGLRPPGVAPGAGHRARRRGAAFTTAPAWLEGAEDRRGRLAPGLAADLVVLDGDPWDDLAAARVAGTMVAGSWVLDLQVAHHAVADLHLVAVVQGGLAHAAAVDEHAVEAAVVGDHGPAAALDHERVAA